jgi:hypothetical protein
MMVRLDAGGALVCGHYSRIQIAGPCDEMRLAAARLVVLRALLLLVNPPGSKNHPPQA